MKQKNKLLSILSLVIVLLLSGCLNYNEEKIDWQEANIGVIESASFKTPAYLNFYGLEGEKIGETSYDCVQTIASFEKPRFYDGKVYANSLGGDLESKKVVEFDIPNNKINLYDIYTGILSISANDEHIFASYSPPENSIINIYNKDRKKIESTLNIDGLVNHMNYFNDLLYVFSDSDTRGEGSFINVINPNTLKIEKTILDFSNSVVFDSIAVGDYIYFTHQYTNDYETPSTTLSFINTKDYSISHVDLDKAYPYQIKQYKNNLYISHFNCVQKEGAMITKYNINTKEKIILTLDHMLNQIEIKDNKLYTTDLSNIYIYNLDDFSLIKKYNIESKKESYRISGFFVIK